MTYNMYVYMYSVYKVDYRRAAAPKNVGYCTRVHWASHFLHGTRNTRPCLNGTPVVAVTLRLRRTLIFWRWFLTLGVMVFTLVPGVREAAKKVLFLVALDS